MLPVWKKQRHRFADKSPYSQSYDFSNSHVWMWELDHNGWAPKNCCFQIVTLQKTLESLPQSDQTSQSLRKWTLNIHWKDWCWSWSSNTLASWCEEQSDWERLWCWERLRAGGEEGDREMISWHHRLNGHDFEQTPGYKEQGSLASCRPWDCSQKWLRDRTTKTLLLICLLFHCTILIMVSEIWNQVILEWQLSTYPYQSNHLNPATARWFLKNQDIKLFQRQTPQRQRWTPPSLHPHLSFLPIKVFSQILSQLRVTQEEILHACSFTLKWFWRTIAASSWCFLVTKSCDFFFCSGKGGGQGLLRNSLQPHGPTQPRACW